jgi:hypothetical protein
MLQLPSFLLLGPTAQGEFGLLNNLPPFFSIPRLTVWFLNSSLLWCEVVSLTPNPQPGGPGYPSSSGSYPLTCPAWVTLPHAQPPTWRTRVSLFVWLLPLDLSGMGDPTSSYATACIALRVSEALKFHHHDKVETP